MRSAPAPAKLARKNDGPQRGGVAQTRSLLFGAVACAGLAACAVGPDYAAPAKLVKPASGRHANRAVDPSQWWRALHDRQLESLIDRAVAASPTLEIALNRLQEARAQEAVVVGTALPMLEASEGGALGTGSNLARGRASQPLVSAENRIGFAQVTNLVGFDAGWELDLFGKFRREIEAAHYACRPPSPLAI